MTIIDIVLVQSFAQGLLDAKTKLKLLFPNVALYIKCCENIALRVFVREAV